MFIYKYDQLQPDQVLSYDEMKEICHSVGHFSHFGQLKLFFTELFFLSKFAHLADTVLYVGAASGYHTTKLADMFPKLTFELWDRGKFETEERPNIIIHHDYFTNADAATYKDMKLLFLCDIRNISVAKSVAIKDNKRVDEIIRSDMELQQTWCQIMRPLYAYVKFRLPYDTPESTYMSGSIYFQPYTPIAIETRLLTNDYDNIVTYNNNLYEDHVQYLNGCIRCAHCDTPHCLALRCDAKDDKWTDTIRDNKLIDNWDNKLALQITYYYLKKLHGIKSVTTAASLFMEIIEFHLKRFPKKAYIIFKE